MLNQNPTNTWDMKKTEELATAKAFYFTNGAIRSPISPSLKDETITCVTYGTIHISCANFLR